ncbi:MAG: AAA family ATPase [Chitinophagaceae bacterium]|nr:AAA family ATPase [Chitinophagaceae bacterium]
MSDKQHHPIKKIVIIGPESTGKSTLCEQLAAHYQTKWCPEYAREYLLQHGTDYSYEDLLTIAKGQLQLEDDYTAKTESKHQFLCIDTDMYVMKVWCEVVFGKCHPFILQQIIKRKYDLYMLCNTDLPWVKDELREYPDLVFRQKLFKIYKDLLVNQSVPWKIISGKSEERLQNAIRAVEEFYPVKN